MIKIVTVIGARPQIIKAAAITRVFSQQYAGQIQEVMVHTGQHYDQNMSQVFFDELEIPQEHYNLQVGSGSHAKQTAAIMVALEEVLLKEKPDYLLLYGDTNSTLAGAVVAAKMFIPIIHIEAGVRAENKTNPEELNRIVCDHYASLLFYYTDSALVYLKKEGFPLDNTAPFHINNPGVFLCGDIMYDNSLYFREKANRVSTTISGLGLTGKDFALATAHRDINTDKPDRLLGLVQGFDAISKAFDLDFIIPLHPRTTKLLQSAENAEASAVLAANPKLHCIPPASYLDMVALESAASLILTDSGGVQREAYFFEKPCIILNEETPWPELLEHGSTLLGSTEPSQLLDCAKQLMALKDSLQYPPIFGDGKAAEFIAATIMASQTK
jgi:UDP-GlcNAc3NAcA epimerase